MYSRTSCKECTAIYCPSTAKSCQCSCTTRLAGKGSKVPCDVIAGIHLFLHLSTGIRIPSTCQSCGLVHATKMADGTGEKTAVVNNGPEEQAPVENDAGEQIRVENGLGEHQAAAHGEENLFPDGATCPNCVLDEDAIAYCVQCKNLLCDECLVYHKRQVATHNHQILDSPKAEEIRQLYRCSIHGDKARDYFCKTCNTAICQHCATSSCKVHEIIVSTDVQKEMSDLLTQAKENRDQFYAHAEFIEAVMVQNDEALQNCEQEINVVFANLIKEFEDRKESALLRLHEETEKNRAKVARQKAYVQNTITEMEKTIKHANNLLSTKKDAKLMVNKTKTCAELEGRSLQNWATKSATVRSWQLEHKELIEYGARFSCLIPNPKVDAIVVEGLTNARIGMTNTFYITADIKDQLDVFNPDTVKNFLSVKIVFTPTNERASTLVRRTITNVENVWTVSYVLRQQGMAKVFVSLCGVQLEDHWPFTVNTAKREVKVGDRVVRGLDWKWDNQDGGAGSKGRVVSIKKHGWINIKWDKNGKSDSYRWGAENSYDIQVVPEE